MISQHPIKGLNILKGLVSTVLLTALIAPGFSAQAEELDIFHTGDVNGLASSYLYDIRLPYLMTSDFVKAQGQALGIKDFGVSRTSVYFHARGHYLWGESFGIRELKTFLKAPPTPIKVSTIKVIEANDSLLFADQAANLAFRLGEFVQDTPRYARQTRTVEAHLYTYPDGVRLLKLARYSPQEQRPEPTPNLTLATDPLIWEMILGFDMQFRQAEKSSQLNLIGKPQGEGTRRMALLDNLRTPESLLVDSGNLLEGLSSVLTDQLSLQRVNSLNMAQKMGYFAINVGKKELQGGLPNLLKEQEKFQLPLISASLKQNGEYVFPPYKVYRGPEHSVAFIGLADPRSLNNLKRLQVISDSTEVLAPRKALEEALLQLQNQESPDVIVLLAHLPAEELRAIESFNRDLHLVLANTGAPLQSLKESLTTDRNSTPRAFVPRSSAHGVNQVHLDIGEQEIELASEMLPVYFDLPTQENYLPDILRIRQNVYKDALDILVPNLGPVIREDPVLLNLFLNSESTQKARERLSAYHALSDDAFLQIYQPFMTRELLHHFEMNVLMERFNAEVVVFKKGSENSLSIPGAMPRLLVYERLKLNDTLNTFYLNGNQLDALRKITGESLSFGGFDAGTSKVWGQPLGGTKVFYKTLIPSGVTALEPVQKILDNAREDTQPDVYLRNVILEEFEALNKRNAPSDRMAQLMKPLWNEKRTLFTLGLEDLQFNVSGYNAYNNDAYSEVRETRVISPSSFNFGARARAYSGIENSWLGWTNAVQARFEGLSVLEVTEDESNERFTENQDDLRFSSELEFRLLKFSLFDTALPLTPFIEGVYDTEFTPTINADTQMRNPIQSELRGVFGLGMPPGPRLKTFKTGLALRRDFNVPNNIEGGVDFKLVHEQPINAGLRWNNDVDFRYFFPSPNDNASSLGLTAQWVSSVNLLLTDNLSLRFFADSYVFQGKLPSTSQIGASVILGVGLGYDRLWKPFYEPLF